MKPGEKFAMKGRWNQMASLFNRIRMRMRPIAVATESKCQLWNVICLPRARKWRKKLRHFHGERLPSKVE